MGIQRLVQLRRYVCAGDADFFRITLNILVIIRPIMFEQFQYRPKLRIVVV